MKKLLLLIIVFLISGCSSDYDAESDMLSESAVIVSKLYVKHHDFVGMPKYLGISVPATIRQINTPEIWGLVLQCKHGIYSVNGTTEFYHGLYRNFEIGDTVLVRYKERYLVTENPLLNEAYNASLVEYEIIDVQN